ncbi:MAG: hypothetical protein RBS99_15160 [Rhodospirillales bacterium]|jgi:hypothetical protein|nr:hypothetical protein [Rhodospirillales bacterium]
MVGAAGLAGAGLGGAGFIAGGVIDTGAAGTESTGGGAAEVAGWRSNKGAQPAATSASSPKTAAAAPLNRCDKENDPKSRMWKPGLNPRFLPLLRNGRKKLYFKLRGRGHRNRRAAGVIRCRCLDIARSAP